jgi:hypothetical protein
VIYHGGCHCGAIAFEYTTAIEPSAWSIRACQCSFCRAHAALSASDPSGTLKFLASQASRLVRYRFGRGTADFLLCGSCGVYIGAAMDSPAGRFGIINVNALRPLRNDLAAPQPMSYEAESTADRSTRRAGRWTPLADGTISSSPTSPS